MKIIKIINVVFAIVLTSTCFAQVKVGEIKTKKSTYVYEPVEHGTYKSVRPGGGLISVVKKNSIPQIYSNSNTKFTPVEVTGYTMDKPLTKSIAEVFSKERLKTLGSEKIIVNMYLDSSGKVISVRYLLYPTSKVVTTELESLEDAIKKNVQVKLSTVPNGAIAPLTSVVRFDKFYSNKSPW
jgi:hypothetical protein